MSTVSMTCLLFAGSGRHLTRSARREQHSGGWAGGQDVCTQAQQDTKKDPHSHGQQRGVRSLIASIFTASGDTNAPVIFHPLPSLPSLCPSPTPLPSLPSLCPPPPPSYRLQTLSPRKALDLPVTCARISACGIPKRSKRVASQRGTSARLPGHTVHSGSPA